MIARTLDWFNDTYAGGQKAIKIDWNAKEGCKLVSFGASWNAWHPTDITNIKENAAIQFAIKHKGEIENIKVGFEDYDRVTKGRKWICRPYAGRWLEGRYRPTVKHSCRPGPDKNQAYVFPV
jgi:hypothetical protein